jgi:hypothetical protein
MSAPKDVLRLVDQFKENLDSYKAGRPIPGTAPYCFFGPSGVRLTGDTASHAGSPVCV